VASGPPSPIIQPTQSMKCCQIIASSSEFFPVGQRHQLVEDLLQSLKPTLLIPRCTGYLLFAAMQVQSVRFTDLRDFVSQLCDAFFKGILHANRLAEHKAQAYLKLGRTTAARETHWLVRRVDTARGEPQAGTLQRRPGS